MSASLRAVCLVLAVWGVADFPPAVGAEPAAGPAPAAGPVKLTGGKNAKFPPVMPGATSEVYKKVGDTELALYIYQPADQMPADRRPAIVFFFGGGWNAGSAAQFEYQSRYLAARGMVAISADYRVRTRNKSQAVDAVRDAKSAVRYVRTHAARLGIDAERIAAGGGSAGGTWRPARRCSKTLTNPGKTRRSPPCPAHSCCSIRRFRWRPSRGKNSRKQ